MINKSIINNVLKNMFNSKVALESGQPEQNVNKPVQRWRYYFFDAPPESSIKFSYLSEILNRDTPDRDATIEKLQGGNTGKYFADYFRWKKVLIATTEYSPDGNTITVYEADLSPMGTKVAGSERVYPEKSNVTVDRFEADLILFSDKRGNSQVINIDNSGESQFSDQDPPGNIINILLNRTKPAGRFVNFNDFTKIFDEYRIWATNLNQLLLPNFDIPRNDDVPGGHYVGGQAAFNKIAGPVLQKMQSQENKNPTTPSLKDKNEQQHNKEESPFQPVDQQDHEKVKGDYLDNPGGKPMVNKFSAQDYKNQRILRNVLSNYLKEDEDSDKDALSTGTTVKGIGTDFKTESEKYKTLATQSRTKAKKYDEMSQVLKQFDNVGPI